MDSWYFLTSAFSVEIGLYSFFLASVFEGVLLCFALYKTVETCSDRLRFQKGVTLSDVLLHDNILYFFA